MSTLASLFRHVERAFWVPHCERFAYPLLKHRTSLLVPRSSQDLSSSPATTSSRPRSTTRHLARTSRHRARSSSRTSCRCVVLRLSRAPITDWDVAGHRERHHHRRQLGHDADRLAQVRVGGDPAQDDHPAAPGQPRHPGQVRHTIFPAAILANIYPTAW